MSRQSSHPNWIGHTISGRYKIESVLGQGGMSAVYKATDPNLSRTVAVKLIHHHLSSDPEFVRRFEQEAAAVAQLRHQHIIQVFDFNHDGDVYYMVLEFLPGETLQDVLKRLNNANQQMPLEDAIRIMATTCDAVAYAHEQGMIHRDLKPANLMINPRGQPILMDFGVAKMLGASQHTATGAIIGTAKYMSPEQARGDRPDERTDIYSLGVILYEMVTGATPFEGESTVAILMKHVSQEIPDIRSIKADVPQGMIDVIKKALAKDRNDRFQTAGEMARALRAIDLSAAGVASPDATIFDDGDQTVMQAPHPATGIRSSIPAPVAMPVTPPPPTASSTKKGGFPLWIAGVAVVALLLIVGAIVAFMLASSGSDDENGAAGVAQVDETATSEAEAVTEPTATNTPAPPSPTPEPVDTDTPEPPSPTPEPETSDTLPTASDANGTTESDEASDSIPTTEPADENGGVQDTAQETSSPTPEPTDSPTSTPVPPSPPPGMALVPAGFFQMGSTTGQADERPEHPVLLSDFFIDVNEVTNNEYRQCVAAGACSPAKTADAFTYVGYRDDPAFGNYPVISVDWDQAVAYCGFMGKRLPTEAEWEYAASGANNLTFPWGNTFDINLSAAGSDDLQPVGSFPGNASPFGALDMAGNANEWVQDHAVDGFYNSSPASNPVATGGGNSRVFRGGSFANPDPAFYTTSRRYTQDRAFSEVDIGFRCAANAAGAQFSDQLVEEFCQVYDAFNPGAACP
jgi:serine/threonine protein kinase